MAALAALEAGAATLIPAGLLCDHQADPLAVQDEHPRLSWILRPGNSGLKGLRQTAYRILAASSAEQLALDHADLWDTGKVPSAATYEIPYAGKPAAAYFWKVRVWDQAGAASPWSPAARWRAGLRAWRAQWIAAQPDGVTPDLEMPLLRREFRLDRPVARAIAYVSGLGQYEFSVNGRKIGEAVLAPGWTNYRKTVFYNAYEITAALRPGDNAVGIMLGNGMYHVFEAPRRYTKLVGSFGQPKALVQIQVQFASGGVARIVSSGAWKVHPGPIVFSHAYGGEDYDARLAPAGWNTPGFDDRDWSSALEVSGPGGALVAQQNPEIRAMATVPPAKVTNPAPGILVYDLGQNFSGWPEITVRGPAGASVKLIPGELLDDGGLVSQHSSKGPQWFSYTLRGDGRESWHPRFSYYGFRYVQVEARDGAEVEALNGQFVHAAAPIAGEFSCSKELFNRIHRLIVAAIRSNMQSVLTDCPHREKLGWLEETHLLGSAVMYNFDVERLYRKIAGDIRDAQTDAGLVPDIAPEYTVFKEGFRDSPEWGSAAVLDPWVAYRHYGDRQTLAVQYETMRRYVAYLTSRASGFILSHGLGDWYDIGPRPPGVSQLTSLGVTATAVYYQDLTTLERIAKLLDKTAEAARWRAQAESVRTAFNAAVLSGDTGVYDRGSQTDYAMPLALGLAPEDRRAELLKRLVDDILAHHHHTTAGDIGFHYVIEALSRGGRSDVIYGLLANPDAPSYAAQLARGATSLTEAWDADPHSSQNHFMLGHAEEWFYRYLAGIDFDLSRAAAERIILRPTPVGDVTAARARYRSPLGVIESSWKVAGGRFIYDIVVPPNAQARVVLPFKHASREVLSGRHHFDVAAR